MDAPSPFDGRVPVSVALALLTSLRDVDTPTDPDALAESDLPLNLRRRLGLSRVVFDQIRRYEKRRGQAISARELASLFELIGRRPDAVRIFAEAGERIARGNLEELRMGTRLGLRVLPRGLRRRAAWRRVRKIARDLSPGSNIRIERKVDALIVEDGLPATAAEGGAGCALIEGAIREVLAAYRAAEAPVVHTRCEARQAAHCAWELGAGEAGTNGAGGSGTETVASATARDGAEAPSVDDAIPHSESAVGG